MVLNNCTYQNGTVYQAVVCQWTASSWVSNYKWFLSFSELCLFEKAYHHLYGWRTANQENITLENK
jgi:hypothetical protein